MTFTLRKKCNAPKSLMENFCGKDLRIKFVVPMIMILLTYTQRYIRVAPLEYMKSDVLTLEYGSQKREGTDEDYDAQDACQSPYKALPNLHTWLSILKSMKPDSCDMHVDILK